MATRPWGTLVALAVMLAGTMGWVAAGGAATDFGGVAAVPTAGPTRAVVPIPGPTPDTGPTRGFNPGTVANARSASEVQIRLHTIGRHTEALAPPVTTADKSQVLAALDSAAEQLRPGTPVQTVADSLWAAYAGLDAIAVTYSDEQAASLRDQVKDQIDALEVVAQQPRVPAGAGTEPEPAPEPERPPLDDALAVVAGISGAAAAVAAVITAVLAVRKHRNQETKPADTPDSEDAPPASVESG